MMHHVKNLKTHSYSESSLPIEILWNIFLSLDVTDVIHSVSLSCKQFRSIVSNKEFIKVYSTMRNNSFFELPYPEPYKELVLYDRMRYIFKRDLSRRLRTRVSSSCNTEKILLEMIHITNKAIVLRMPRGYGATTMLCAYAVIMRWVRRGIKIGYYDPFTIEDYGSIFERFTWITQRLGFLNKANFKKIPFHIITKAIEIRDYDLVLIDDIHLIKDPSERLHICRSYGKIVATTTHNVSHCLLESLDCSTSEFFSLIGAFGDPAALTGICVDTFVMEPKKE
jgi:hypothetical protein